MIIDKSNWLQVLKPGVKFKMNRFTRRFQNLREDIREYALNGGVFCVVECSPYSVQYAWAKDMYPIIRMNWDDDIWYLVETSYSNKGLKTCLQCGVPTEPRRDFSDMSIREFCPRCRR